MAVIDLQTREYCYDDSRVIRRVLKQAWRRFQGVSGSFD
jgi:hypothetical protein